MRQVNGRTLDRTQLDDVDVLLVRSVTRVDKELLAGTPVQFVGTATSGFDHIDREYLAREGIAFACASGSNANSVVEYVLSAIANVGDKLEQLLSGGEVGIVGFGHVGKALAARLQALGIRFQVYDPWLDQDSIIHAADLGRVLACDIVTLHPELTREHPWPSYHLLGAAELRQMHPEALLINASRGAVVDNRALHDQLLSGAGPLVVLDVWEGEPVISAPLLQRVALGTAHIAGYSLDAKLLATRLLGEAVAAHFKLHFRAGDNPVGTPTALSVPGTLSGAALLRFLLQSRYDIRVDDANLRDIGPGGHGETHSAEGFDALRRSYRERRELAGTVVTAESLSDEQCAVILALGCSVDPGGLAS